MNDNKETIIQRPSLYNIEIEQAILGAIINNNGLFNKLIDLNFKREYFYLQTHQKIYDYINNNIMRNNIVVNNIILKSFFDNDELIKENGGSLYINTLLYKGAGVIGITDYVKILEDLFIKRSLIDIANNIADNVYKNISNLNSKDIIENTETKILKLDENRTTQNPVLSIAEGLDEVIKTADEYIKNINDFGYFNGVSSGYTSIDDYLQGFQPGSLNILAGGTSMGKTTLALNFAIGSAEYLKRVYEKKGEKLKKVLYYTFEMPALHLCAKLMSKYVGLSSEKILKGEKGFENKYANALNYLSDIPLFIDETPGMTITDLKIKIKRISSKEDIGIIYVDHLGLLKGVEKKSQLSQVQQISEIVWELKQIAREFNIPIVALSQLNRESTKNEENDKNSFNSPLMPQLHHLKDSSSVEQDADVVMILHRPCYYISRKKPSEDNHDKYSKWQEAMAKYKIGNSYERSQIGILKNRLGRTTEKPIELYYSGIYSDFIAPELYEQTKKERAEKQEIENGKM